MYHYTYMIRSSNAMFYIGARSCAVLPEDDKYYGSCDSFTAWQKENNEALDKHIAGVFPSRALAIEHEIELHNFYDVAKNKLFWNKAKQTAVGFDTTGTTQSDELKLNKSIKTKGRPKTDEHKEKIRQAHIGKVKSEQHRKALSESKKGKPSPLKGVSIGKGRILSDSHKEKIGLSNRGKVRSIEHCEKQSKARKGVTPAYNPTRYENVECPHCGKIGMKANMTRYHFNNCTASGALS